MVNELPIHQFTNSLTYQFYFGGCCGVAGGVVGAGVVPAGVAGAVCTGAAGFGGDGVPPISDPELPR